MMDRVRIKTRQVSCKKLQKVEVCFPISEMTKNKSDVIEEILKLC